jgi:hypothetical protein
LKKEGYRKIMDGEKGDRSLNFAMMLYQLKDVPESFFKHRNDGILSVATLFAGPTFNKSQIEWLRDDANRCPFNLNLRGQPPKAIDENYVICTLGNVSKNTVAGVIRTSNMKPRRTPIDN